MNIAEIIYQHVKTMTMAKSIEVLHFVEFLETKPDVIAGNAAENNLLEFMKNLPAANGQNSAVHQLPIFQALRV